MIIGENGASADFVQVHNVNRSNKDIMLLCFTIFVGITIIYFGAQIVSKKPKGNNSTESIKKK